MGLTRRRLPIISLRTNKDIRVPTIRLISHTGEQIGILATRDALRIAEETSLDLVEISPEATPPVCKIMDYGKYKYEQGVKQRENRKHQQRMDTKEMKLRPKIEDHDYDTKKRHITRFLEEGHKVKVTIMLKGREQGRPEIGYRLLTRLAEDLDSLAKIDTPPAQYGRDMTMVLIPKH